MQFYKHNVRAVKITLRNQQNLHCHYPTKKGSQPIWSKPSGRMAIVLASFILAVQEILDLLYFALLFINDQTELNSLVAKNACCAPQGILHSSLC